MGNKQVKHDSETRVHPHILLSQSLETKQIPITSIHRTLNEDTFHVSMKNVPSEVVLTILLYSDFSELYKFQRISKYFRTSLTQYLFNEIKKNEFLHTKCIVTEEQKQEAEDIRTKCRKAEKTGRALHYRTDINGFRSSRFYSKLAIDERQCWNVISEHSTEFYAREKRLHLSDLPPTTIFTYDYVVECADGTWFQFSYRLRSRLSKAFFRNFENIEANIREEEEDIW